MKRDHTFVWTPDSLCCFICGGGHHPWDGIGESAQTTDERRRQLEEARQDAEARAHRDIFNLRWVL